MTFRARLAHGKEVLGTQLGEFKFWIARMGWGVITGFSLLILSAFGYVFGVLGAERELDKLQKNVEVLGREVNARQGEMAGYGASVRSVHGTVHFPAPEERETMLLRVVELARQMGLITDSGTYQEIRSGTAVRPLGKKLVKYQLSIPLQGSYPAIRDWLSAVMNELPTIAVEELTMRRENGDAPVVIAQIRFAFYFEER